MNVIAVLPNGTEREWLCIEPKIGAIIKTVYYPDMDTIYTFEIAEMSEDKKTIWVELVDKK